MKYFTPELLVRFQSSDDDVFVEAHEEWERAIVRSNRRWAKIKDHFPQAVRRFEEDQVCLHDAHLLSMGRQGDTLVMVLQPEPPAQTMLVLTFSLDGEPEINPAALPGGPDPDYALWMYEEWDVDRHKRCWFEVLFTNGWSVKLPFRDFHYLIGQRLFPLPKAIHDPAFPPAQPAVPRPA